jgi:hypothetical protein
VGAYISRPCQASRYYSARRPDLSPVEHWISSAGAVGTTSVMSGIEVAGLVLGGFPLLITALEHLVKLRTFRRECQKDLNRLRDTQLVYRESMRTLLIPLQYDGTLDATQIELLLDDPTSQGWSDMDVQDEVSRRLGNFKDSYFTILQEMNHAILKLAKASKVEDARFQASLHSNQVEQLYMSTVST